jgi:very-short-patch-repair endonuclease
MSKSELEQELEFQLYAAHLDEGMVREFMFLKPRRRYRADFAWPELKLLVEVEGGVYSGGRHVRGKGFTEDLHRSNLAQLENYMILRFTGEQIKSGLALDLIERAIKLRS